MPNNKHHRIHDHEEMDLDTNIVIDGNIGDFLSGTTVHDVLENLVNSGGPDQSKVMVSYNDTTPGYLATKIIAGTNITFTELDDGGNERLLIDAATGSGGGGGGWDTVSTNGVALQAGRINVWDQNQDAKIAMDGGLYMETVGDGIYFSPDAGTVVSIETGDGLVFPDQTSDPGSPANGQVYFRTTGGNMLRMFRTTDNAWVFIPWMATSGSATITSGNTSVTVTHGAGFDPISARGVEVWPTNNPTNDPGWFWVSGVTDTQFVINVRSNPGASGATFAWRIVPQ